MKIIGQNKEDKMKKIVSNLSVMIFVIGCAIMEITTWLLIHMLCFI